MKTTIRVKNRGTGKYLRLGAEIASLPRRVEKRKTDLGRRSGREDANC